MECCDVSLEGNQSRPLYLKMKWIFFLPFVDLKRNDQNKLWVKKLITSKVTWEVQSTAYWKGKTEHVWYSLEELGDLCITLSRFMKMRMCSKPVTIRMYVKQVHRLKYNL